MADDNAWNGKSGSLIKKPGKGWLHSDEVIQHEGVTYNIKYVGSIPVNESMKSLNFETRTLVARESIRRVVECARFTNMRRSKKLDENLNRILNSKPDVINTNSSVALHINIQLLKVTLIETDEDLFHHLMQNISFACGGDTDIQDYVAYVAKDDHRGRACYVFECLNGLANNVITTIGQAFELRFKKFLHTNNSSKNSGSATSSQISNSALQSNKNIPNISPPEAPVKKFNPMEQNFAQDLNNVSPTFQTKHLDDNLQHMSWFHGLLSRDNAEKMLKHDGDYLVRTSNRTAEKQYVLSGRYEGECRHIFLVDPNGTVRTKDRVFNDICHLIQFHQDNNVPIVSKDNELLLQHPISRII